MNAARRKKARDGRHVSHEAPVVAPLADHMIIEKHFHGEKLARQPLERKGNAVRGEPVWAFEHYGQLGLIKGRTQVVFMLSSHVVQ